MFGVIREWEREKLRELPTDLPLLFMREFSGEFVGTLIKIEFQHVRAYA